ncbi:uncharacterized protein EAE97_000205 [Botrytis byssoidea]|uniref:Uncharacterized protein n=1 Tax=Botrytis byssoidea TaxID=139641 RepID=A0A9P5IUX4_9HELO|nr:uncharacterized protein EAE97_000205 [Botrytis byssoidea]KAF7954946.1 hypothetical protein EAE97_000205 [Botrytis byssoidea]
MRKIWWRALCYELMLVTADAEIDVPICPEGLESYTWLDLEWVNGALIDAINVNLVCNFEVVDGTIVDG